MFAPTPARTRTRVRALLAAFDRLYPRLEAAARDATLPVGAEWLLDNHFVVRRALREVRTGLQRRFERHLPRHGQAPCTRIEAEGLALLRTHEGLLDHGALVRHMRLFAQGETPHLAELWALPLLLRLSLLEQLAADGPRLLEAKPESSVDHRVANCVRSLLWIQRSDWSRLVEELSEVHTTLLRDPSGHYGRMDFETRDRYRGVIETLARASGRSEQEVAWRAIELATAAPVDSLASHVGAQLLDPRMRAQLRLALGERNRVRAWLRAVVRRRRVGLYIGTIVIVALAHLGLLLWLLLASGLAQRAGGTLAIVALGILALVPAMTIGVSLVNWVVSLVRRPTPLAKLDFSTGVPDESRTLIVVPGMLHRPHDADALVARLEGHYLATREANVVYAIVTDFADADSARLDTDDELLARARAGIAALNQHYGQSEPGRFHLLHRRRVWSEQQGRYMGWERKRGKLEQLNDLLLGRGDRDYVVHEGERTQLQDIRYVLTLDADTVLPPGAARRLIETLAHPLNRPRFDDRGQVTSGYTVLQPRAEVTPDSAPSRFARAYAGDGAFDIYSRAVSDVYQDLFGEGTFVGKGIYDLHGFARSVEGRIPENWILSHDLLEGACGRAGLVSDVIVYEDYPSCYLAHARRLHRWIRGDWQLLPWIGPWVPTRSNWARNRINALSRWKLLDNLRRSMLASSLVGFVGLAWLTLPELALVWTTLVLAVMATPTLAELGGGVLRMRPGAVRPAIAGLVSAVAPGLARWSLRVSFLVHGAILDLDAIARALLRTLVLHRRQLEWTPAALAGCGADQPKPIWRALGPTMLVPGGLAIALAWIEPIALLAAAPLLLPWLAAPVLAIWTAKPGLPRAAKVELARDDPRLRRLARQTWAYFEHVIGPEDHWLPPDHLQEQPKSEIAHRTSPTNIAMGLLATLSAYEFGYLDRLELVVRLRNTLENLSALPRHHGHLLNWYDTTTLAPLEPRYVSTVDNGNLAAALLVLEQSCREFADAGPSFDLRLRGLEDSLDVLARVVTTCGPSTDATLRQIGLTRATLAHARPRTWASVLEQLANKQLPAIESELLLLFERPHGEHDSATIESLRRWMAHAHAEAASLRSELTNWLPYLVVLDEQPGTPHEHEALARLLEELEQLPVRAQPHEPDAARVETSAVLQDLLARLGEVRDGPIHEPSGVASGIASARVLDVDSFDAPWHGWLERLEDAMHTSLAHEQQLRVHMLDLADHCAELFAAMDFRFLYDRARELFYIGYDVGAQRYDAHHYDLLASEARIASLVAIAKGEAPPRHWAKLGRPLGRFGGARALLSWSGTMFEYLMPPLLFDEGRQTLLDVSAHAAIQAQIAYGRARKVPWGISESGYARLDSQRNYQYRAFGVPATGLRRELERELVVAPYASMLALRHEPDAVIANFDAFERLGGVGALGLYEAIDYTRERVPVAQRFALVRSYMSHHQGMIMIALHGFCHAGVLVERAHRHPLLATVSLLLRERAPGRVPVDPPQPAAEAASARRRPGVAETWTIPSEGEVEAQVLSNGRYGVLLTAGGAGHSWWRGTTLTRPCEDRTLEQQGLLVRVDDREHAEQWSFVATDAEPTTTGREVELSAHGARISLHERGLLAQLDVIVPLDTDAELRMLQLHDRSGRRRRLEISAFAELVLTNARSHARHPAFSKLFVDTQLCASPPMIIAHRRPREHGEQPLWLGCALVSDRVNWVAWETDRQAYLGRGGSEREAAGTMQAMRTRDSPVRATLDSCVALRGEVELAPNGRCSCAVVMFVAPSRAALRERGRALASMTALRRLLLDAEHESRMRLHNHEIELAPLRRAQRLLSAVLFPREHLRAPAEVLARNHLGQPSLWRYGISGDWPLLLVRVTAVGTSTIIELLRAHAHWHGQGVPVDLVFVEQHASGYGTDMRRRLTQLFEREGAHVGAPDGGVFLIHEAGLAEPELDLLLACASVILDADIDDLEAWLDVPGVPHLPRFEPEGQTSLPTPALDRPRDLMLDNGYGGFSPDGREYVIHLEPGQHTPAPWINVISNPQFGCCVSERGAGYTWSLNAGLNRLSAWSNDALLDPPSESLYLRDEADGSVWSPLPGPGAAAVAYQIRHGAGWTSFTHNSHGLRQRVEIFVAPDDPVKLVRLVLEDCWGRPRRLTVSHCVEWLLGAQRSTDLSTLRTDFDAELQVALANNPWNPSFAARWAFCCASESLHGTCFNREEFFGRRAERSRPAALQRIGLLGEHSRSVDPCAVLQLHVQLDANGQACVHFVLGQGRDREHALALAERYRDPDQVSQTRAAVDRHWTRLLGAVEVHGPETSFNLFVNRWLRYQCIAARLWGRTGFYQSSGAFGFRDQLQDVLALLHGAPELVRAHLLDAASRQYEAGDVQHWWHPPTGQGLRSRCSDDLLWLPLAVARYVEATGDLAILHESVPYLDSPPLSEGELERYEDRPVWTKQASLHAHCLAALERGHTHGPHGLPLIGSGDWNDGFSSVGVGGRGESVWLGWFLLIIDRDYSSICELLGEPEQAAQLRARADALVPALEAAWDGDWYRRAYDDDGRAIGSASNDACQLDSIAQSFAVLSDRADPQRVEQAMQAVTHTLVDEQVKLIRLFTPPFDSARPELGYIEGYPPGVRENGGQYTHAAVWVAWALAELGAHDQAHALLCMLLPTSHTANAAAVQKYRVEPYAIAADIYAGAHEGRGGWTWYTGAAAWTYRLAVEQILGVRRRAGRITLDPALPSSWASCELTLRERETEYHVHLRRRADAPLDGLLVDGVAQTRPFALPVADGRVHELSVDLR